MLRQHDIAGQRPQPWGETGVLADTLREMSTPAFAYDESLIQRNLDWADAMRDGSPCKVLFAVKSFSFIDGLRVMATRLDGFAASSLFEARLVREASGGDPLHLTTPGIRPDEVDEIASLCDYVSFNSLGQWLRYRDTFRTSTSCGLRVNPQMSFVDDERYDPCRKHSKLGVPLDDLVSTIKADSAELSGLEGLLVHSNCDSTDFGEMLATVQRLQEHLDGLLRGLRWVNLGGGYLFDDATDIRPLHEAIDLLHSRYDLQVFVEPGAAFVRTAGYVVSSVLDMFQSGGKVVAVLDTTVNHMPEVFEYGFRPDVLSHVEDGAHEYILAGCTCLAGDVFGEYSFTEPLDVGARVVFYNAGAYTLSKAHTFNGVNLPTVYAITEAGELVLKKRFTYPEYAASWGAGVSAPV